MKSNETLDQSLSICETFWVLKMGLGSLFSKLLLVAVLHQAHSQTTGRFIVDVASYIGDLGSAESRCSGAVISTTHVKKIKI